MPDDPSEATVDANSAQAAGAPKAVDASAPDAKAIQEKAAADKEAKERAAAEKMASDKAAEEKREALRQVATSLVLIPFTFGVGLICVLLLGCTLMQGRMSNISVNGV